MTMGISARDLSDEDLLRELTHLKEKTDDIGSDGTADQQANHRHRTAELEKEFLRRNPPAGGDRADTLNSSGAGPSGELEGGDDVSPAGPDDGPVNDQPEPG